MQSMQSREAETAIATSPPPDRDHPSAAAGRHDLLACLHRPPNLQQLFPPALATSSISRLTIIQCQRKVNVLKD